jgi:hypothetical protein
MKFTSCQIMRKLTLLSGVLLAVGVVTFVLSQALVTLAGGQLPLMLLFIAFILLLSSPLVLMINLLLSVLPGSRHLLEHCNH